MPARASEEALSGEDREALRRRYVDMFGELPPLPAGRLRFTAEVAPAFLRHVEDLREGAFDSPFFDAKVVQLLVLSALLARGEQAARWHALAARRAGATWQELQGVVELVSAVSALGPANQGGALLHELREQAA